MKKIIIAMCAVFCLAPSVLWAGADTTYTVGYYFNQGFTADKLVQDVFDRSTLAGNQLKRIVISLPLDVTEASGATNDSDYTAIWTCPAGMTLTVDSVFLWAATEGDVDGDAPGGFRINIRKYDLSATAYDTLVTDVCDKESLAYDLRNAFLSWGAGTADTTKILTTGDALIVMIAQDSAFVTSAACTLPMITIKARLDE